MVHVLLDEEDHTRLKQLTADADVRLSNWCRAAVKLALDGSEPIVIQDFEGGRKTKLVHFLLNDNDYLRLLQVTTQPLSVWCRAAIKGTLDK